MCFLCVLSKIDHVEVGQLDFQMLQTIGFQWFSSQTKQGFVMIPMSSHCHVAHPTIGFKISRSIKKMVAMWFVYPETAVENNQFWVFPWF